MIFEPWLCYNGYEIANANRTLSYIMRGLISPSFETCVDASVVSGDYTDVYHDLYTGPDPFSSPHLCCYCSVMNDPGIVAQSYHSPVIDDAPWYQSTRVESGEFMGFLPDSVTVDPVVVRDVSPRGGFGAVLGRAALKQRIVAVKGVMYASSRRGLQWGERWLSDVLAGNLCATGDDTGELIMLPTCPLSNDLSYFRSLAQVGLIDGPHFTPFGNTADCYAQTVDFQFAAGAPYLLAPPTTLLDHLVTDSAPSSILASTAAWVGDAGLRITLTANTDAEGVRVSLVPVPDEGTCPAGPSPTWVPPRWYEALYDPGTGDYLVDVHGPSDSGARIDDLQAFFGPYFTLGASGTEYSASPISGADGGVKGEALQQFVSTFDSVGYWAGGPNAAAAYTCDLVVGAVLTIDGATHRVTLFDPTSKREVNGIGVLAFDGALVWPEVPPCSDVCVTVRTASGEVNVLVEQIPREL